MVVVSDSLLNSAKRGGGSVQGEGGGDGEGSSVGVELWPIKLVKELAKLYFKEDNKAIDFRF